jgi:hypothetical protein
VILELGATVLGCYFTDGACSSGGVLAYTSLLCA